MWGAAPLLLVMAGCAVRPGNGECDASRYERELQNLRAEINAEIGEAEASSAVACRVLPLGAKPCGGPWSYLVYSAEASDPERLEALAADYHRVDDERNRACELASNCMMEPEPTPVLEGGRCVAAE